MMNYFLTETQQAIRELAREIAQKKIKPVRAHCDEKEQLPWEIVEEYRKANLFGLWLPEAYGG
ncbi:MAG: acyl-CoA dehydrogenase family protein, partial [Elusimicrobiales bacterium]|nr:acyl-CoA dehydrogenase family protein [Elusimicrobiales bacterium]